MVLQLLQLELQHDAWSDGALFVPRVPSGNCEKPELVKSFIAPLLCVDCIWQFTDTHYSSLWSSDCFVSGDKLKTLPGPLNKTPAIAYKMNTHTHTYYPHPPMVWVPPCSPVRGEGLCLNGFEEQYITQTDTVEIDNTLHVTYVCNHFKMQILTETEALK